MIMKLSGMEIPQILFEKEGEGGGGSPEPTNSKHDEHLQNAIRERDEAKAKARETEKKLSEISGKLQEIEDAKKMETGEFQKLADERLEKVKLLENENNVLKQAEAELKEYKETRKKQLLELIPEEKRSEWESSDIGTLEKVTPLFNLGEGAKGMDSGKSGKTIITTNKKWDDFTTVELDEIAKSNKSEFDKMYREKYGNVKVI